MTAKDTKILIMNYDKTFCELNAKTHLIDYDSAQYIAIYMNIIKLFRVRSVVIYQQIMQKQHNAPPAYKSSIGFLRVDFAITGYVESDWPRPWPRVTAIRDR